MEQLSRTGNTLASCPLLSAPIRDIKGVCECVCVHRLNKGVLTRSEEKKKRVVGWWAEGVCVCDCVHSLWHTHSHTLSFVSA